MALKVSEQRDLLADLRNFQYKVERHLKDECAFHEQILAQVKTMIAIIERATRTSRGQLTDADMTTDE
jgi:hypothetical protein